MIRKRYLFAATILVAALIIAAATVRGPSLLEITASLNSVSTTRGELDTFVAITSHSSGGLEQLGRRTLLAPNDDAFESYFERTGTDLDTLLSDTETVDRIVDAHLIRGGLSSTQLLQRPRIRTIGDTNINVEDGLLTQGSYSARIIRADAYAANGVVHVIDGVLV